MKKLFLIGAFLLGIFSVNGYSLGFFGGGGGDCCPQPCGQPTGECYCLYVDYQPCYYTTKRCIEEQIPCSRRCCRMVPQYYQVQRCRYVPEYYCDTQCRYVPEYYDVPETKCCKRIICEPQCRYVPRYYWKHVCADQNSLSPVNPCCP
jgi:hypothetical protein